MAREAEVFLLPSWVSLEPRSVSAGREGPQTPPGLASTHSTQSVNTHLLSTYYVPLTVPGLGDTQ